MASKSIDTDILFPGSPAYEKARKQHLRSTRTRPSDESFAWTPFRASEKKYKARFPPPDLSDVLDLALLDEERKDEVDMGVWKGRTDAIKIQEIGLKEDAGKRRRRAFCVPQVPGLILLPRYLCPETQRRLVRWSLADHARGPNKTNLDVHYKVPEEGLWNLHVRSETKTILPREGYPAAVTDPQDPQQLISNAPASTQNHQEPSSQPKPQPTPSARLGSTTASELIPRLRWANIGWFYHWGTKQYDFSRGKVEVGEPVRSICKGIVRSVDWRGMFGGELPIWNTSSGWGETSLDWNSWDSSYEPDAGIVNFYQYKDTLMGHVDRSEVCATEPLVSLSLGNAAVFLIGGLTRDENPVAILLRSGDAVVMAGPGCRRSYHGVPRILEGTLPVYLDAKADPSADWAAYGRYLRTTRINVNETDIKKQADGFIIVMDIAMRAP